MLVFEFVSSLLDVVNFIELISSVVIDVDTHIVRITFRTFFIFNV